MFLPFQITHPLLPLPRPHLHLARYPTGNRLVLQNRILTLILLHLHLPPPHPSLLRKVLECTMR